jgi:aldehyde dehydrogenase (NAD+)
LDQIKRPRRIVPSKPLEDGTRLVGEGGGFLQRPVHIHHDRLCNRRAAGAIKQRLAQRQGRSAQVQYPAGRPNRGTVFMRPVVGDAQFARIQTLIGSGIAAGARLVAGGMGRPEGLDRGYYVRPTVFSGVTSAMRILRDEIFGPVLCIQGYCDEADALRLANDTPFGLSACVSSADPARARRFARGIRAGMVHLNGAPSDFAAPFGGYKASGNGSEWGRYGFESYLEVKSIFGHA